MNVQILYKGKYGATAQYAKWLGETFGTTAVAVTGNTATPLTGDIIVLGSSVYIGQLQLKSWLLQHESSLQNRKVFLFIVSATDVTLTEKWGEYVRNTFPNGAPSDWHLYFLPGRLNYKKLAFSDKLMLRIGAMLTRNKKARREMLTDFDLVRRENLHPLVGDIKSRVSTGVEF